MTVEKKLKITTLSVILAFVVQLMASAWFLSGLSAAIRVNAQTISNVSERESAIERRVYSTEVLSAKVTMLEKTVDEMRKDLKSLLRQSK